MVLVLLVLGFADRVVDGAPLEMDDGKIVGIVDGILLIFNEGVKDGITVDSDDGLALVVLPLGITEGAADGPLLGIDG